MEVDTSDFEGCLKKYSDMGLVLCKTDMDSEYKTITYWVSTPKGNICIAENFKKDMQGFFTRYKVLVKAKEI